MTIGGGVLVLAVAVGNVMSNPTMPPADVRHDVAALFDLRAAVVCANEIEPPNYRATFRRTAREAGYRTAGLSSPNPVAVRHSSPWRAASVRVRFLSGGVPRITPDRWATVVRLVDDNGNRAVVICTHLVSRAWTHVEASTALRRELWRREVATIRRIVRYWRSRGAPVVVLGDLNHPEAVRWARRQRVLANTGLLQATAIPPAGMRATRTGGRTISSRQLFTDHPMPRRGVVLRPLPSGT